MGKSLQSEGGGVLVLVAVTLPVLILFVMFVVETGNWFEHKRHLQVQVDAAAFAGGDVFQNCFSGGGSAAIYNEANKYAGAGGAYNSQVGGANRGAVTVLYQSKTYQVGGPAPDDTTSDPCASPYMFDVKGTEAGLPLFLKKVIPGLASITAINAHARVSLNALGYGSPSLPLAVPDINPKQAAVTFVNESSGAELTGCSGASLVTGTTCTFALGRPNPPTANGLNLWTGGGSVQIPASPPQQVGVRVGLGGSVGSCANTAGTGSYSCFDAATSTAGLVMIRDYATSSTTTSNPPVLDGVWPASCSGYGPYYYLASGTCASGVSAEVDFGTGSTRPNANYHVRAAVGGTTADLTPASYDSAANAWIWSTSAVTPPFTLPASGGAQGVSMSWEVNDTSATISGNKCSGGGGNKCKGAFAGAPQQRFYGAIDDLGQSGPIRLLQVSAGSDPNAVSLRPGAANLTVTLGVAGSYQVHTPCSGSGTGAGYSCSTDPTIPLRLKATNGNTTYTIDCGGSGGGAQALVDQITKGCTTPFSINTADVCPDPANPTPTDCAPVNSVGSGIKTGPTRQAMNDRFAPGGNCLPNNYPSFPSSDPRVVLLIVTDFSAFNSNGSGVQVPVTTFGAFYVTGWDSAVASCSSQNDPAPGGTSNVGEIWGHFIKYVATNNAVGGSAPCDPLGLNPCVPILSK